MLDLFPYQSVIEQNVCAALAEDLGTQAPFTNAFMQDLTVSLLPAGQPATATTITREAMVLSGIPWVEKTFEVLARHTSTTKVEIKWHKEEGESINANETLCTLSGDVQSLLTAERTALNFLQTLSATATATARLVSMLNGYNTQLLDTRKTLPGLRIAQKYAVSCGGGQNHRIGLYDAFLIKENHIAAAGSIAGVVSAAKAINSRVKLEIEVETIDELKQAFETACDVVMLDNFTFDDIRYAVANKPTHIKLEASGNIDESNLLDYAKTGVDYISMGSLTKHIQAIDLSFRLHN